MLIMEQGKSLRFYGTSLDVETGEFFKGLMCLSIEWNPCYCFTSVLLECGNLCKCVCVLDTTCFFFLV